MEYNHENEHEAKHKGLEEVLVERFEEELEDACEYAKLAEKYPDAAKDFYAIGREEVTHADHLHTLLRHHAHEFSDEHEAKWHRVLRKYGFEK
jgi:hypothetical protein